MQPWDIAGSLQGSELNQRKIQQTDADVAGQAAAGNFVKSLFNGSVPGAQPMQLPMGGQSSMQPQPPTGGQPQPPQQPMGGQPQPSQPQAIPAGGGMPQAPQNAVAALAQRLRSMVPGAQPMMPQAQAGAASPPPTPGGPPGGVPSSSRPPGGNPIQSLYGQMTLQQVAQGVVRSNPGIEKNPQALFSAMRQLMPLMRPDEAQYFRAIQLQQQQQHNAVMEGQGQTRLDQGQQRVDDMRAAYGLPPRGTGGNFGQTPGSQGGGQQEGGADSIADQIASGKRPPTTTGLYRMSAPVAAALAQRYPNFNQAQANIQYQGALKHVQSLNGPQLTRFAALGQSVENTIDEVRRLSTQLQNTGIPALNALKLKLLVETRGNTPQGQMAGQYIAAVNTLKEEFANLATGGTAPHEAAWSLANQQINGNYGIDQLNASLTEVQRLINYRLQALSGGQTQGTGRGQNPYSPQQPAAEPPGGQNGKGAPPARPAAVPDGSMYSPSRGMWRDPQGKIYGPDGTPARE